MLPLWIYTLGQQFVHPDTSLVIPFQNIASALATIVLPLLVGVLVKNKLPRVSKVIIKVIKPVTIGAVMILLGVGIYSNMYIFKLFSPRIVLAGCLLPYMGYVLGGLVAFICRQPWTTVKTIAIETGLQNIGIAIVLMLFSFPSPDGDIAAVAPIASGVMTPLPLFVVTIAYLIYKKCNPEKYKKVPDDAIKEKIKDTDGEVVVTEKMTAV